jgi:hypothetical protein
MTRDYTTKLQTDATFTEGVYRWKSNNHVVPADILESVGIPEEVLARCKVARDKDFAVVIANHKAYRAKNGYSDEELFEMRAAFGEGATVVDALTGKKTKL